MESLDNFDEGAATRNTYRPQLSCTRFRPRLTQSKLTTQRWPSRHPRPTCTSLRRSTFASPAVYIDRLQNKTGSKSPTKPPIETAPRQTMAKWKSNAVQLTKTMMIMTRNLTLKVLVSALENAKLFTTSTNEAYSVRHKSFQFTKAPIRPGVRDGRQPLQHCPSFHRRRGKPGRLPDHSNYYIERNWGASRLFQACVLRNFRR